MIFLLGESINMAVVKLLHVTFVFIWVGNLLALTRLIGYHSKLDAAAQLQMGPIYNRMYKFVGLPCLGLAFLFGSILIMQLNQEKSISWFFYKLVFAAGLIICDFVCGHYISLLVDHTEKSGGLRYKILHGLCGLLLIGVLASIYLLRPVT